MSALLSSIRQIRDLAEASENLIRKDAVSAELGREVERALTSFMAAQPDDVVDEAYSAIVKRYEDGDSKVGAALGVLTGEYERRRHACAGPVEEGPRGTTFVFLVPVKPKAVSADWRLVTKNLNDTIASILSSTNGDFTIMIASHDRLDIPDDKRIEQYVVDFDHVAEVVRGIADKQRKLRYLASILRHRDYVGYIMLLDADDYVSNRLVDYVLTDNNKSSYIMTQGYRLDVTSAHLSLQGSDFDKSCGSCFVGYFEPEELPVSFDDRGNYFSGFMRHTECLDVATEHGKTPTQVPFPAVVYVTNHADSLRMARLEGKLRPVSKEAALDEGSMILAQEFGYRAN